MAMSIPSEAWGNRGGWITGTIIGLLVAALVGSLVSEGGATPPTELGASPARWDMIELPPSLADVLGRGGEADGQAFLDAAEDFLNIQSTQRAIEALAEPGNTAAPVPADVPLLDRIVDASGPRPTKLFAGQPEILVNHDRTLPQLEALSTIGRAAVRQASFYAARGVREDDDDDLQRAAELYEATFSLGRSLAAERLVFRELQDGYRLMGDGIGGLAAIAKVRGDAARAARLTAIGDDLKRFVDEEVTPVWEAIGSPDTALETDTRAARHAGDVLAIASSDVADSMWRTNAVLRLGVAQHTAPRRADRARAALIVERLAESAAEPNVRRAAESSRDLEADDVRLTR